MAQEKSVLFRIEAALDEIKLMLKELPTVISVSTPITEQDAQQIKQLVKDGMSNDVSDESPIMRVRDTAPVFEYAVVSDDYRTNEELADWCNGIATAKNAVECVLVPTPSTGVYTIAQPGMVIVRVDVHLFQVMRLPNMHPDTGFRVFNPDNMVKTDAEFGTRA